MKLKELKETYKTTFSENFIERVISFDKTPTKKYAGYMLKHIQYTNNIYTISDLVIKFDKLLPYIDNKDIYSPYYTNIQNLQKAVEVAEIRKNIKQDNEKLAKQIYILKETEDFILLHPKTYEASCKYGYNTTWCVTYHNDSYYKSYKENLIFLIMKRQINNKNYQKIAFHREKNNERIDIYNAADSRSTVEYISSQLGSDINFDEILSLCEKFFNRNKYKFIKKLIPWSMYNKIK